MFVNKNGNLYPVNESVLSAANRSFLYGDGLFESMRMINGSIMFLEKHLERLKKGMRMLHINYSNNFNADYLSEEINKLANRNGINDNGRVRLNVFRKEGGFYAPEDDNSEWLISVTANNENNYVLNSTGLHSDVFSEIKKPVNKFSAFKTCNALIYVMAGVWKNEKKLDEVLIVNEFNRICEGLNANVFIVKNNQIFTTPVSEGCIEGVMRNEVINIIFKQEIPFFEEKIEVADLITADEIFLTNASSGVRWVGAYKDKRYFCKYSKIIVNSLNEIIRDEF